MKALVRSSLGLAAAAWLVACGGGKDEETIRITIEKGGGRVTAEPVVSPTPGPSLVREGVGGLPTPTPWARHQMEVPPASPQAEPPGEGLSFAVVAGRLDVTENGRDGAKRNWGALRGRRVTWTGMVHEANPGRRGFRLFLRSVEVAPAGRYNIVVEGDGQAAAAGALRPGQVVTVTGSIHRADYGRSPATVVVSLEDGSIR